MRPFDGDGPSNRPKLYGKVYGDNVSYTEIQARPGQLRKSFHPQFVAFRRECRKTVKAHLIGFGRRRTEPYLRVDDCQAPRVRFAIVEAPAIPYRTSLTSLIPEIWPLYQK
jgi:hypothetical protein